MRRNRWMLFGLAVVVTGAGLAARFGLSGRIADILGGILYAVLIYVLLALVLPAARTRTLTITAAVWCLGVECWQLTGVPAELGDRFPPLRLVLGAGFEPLDLLAAVAGVALAAGADLVRRHRQ